MASFNQHLTDREVKIVVNKVWESETDDLVYLMIEADGIENTIFMSRSQLETLVGKTMGYLMPELQGTK